MNEELIKILEVYAHNGREYADDVVTCKFTEGALEHTTPIIIASICVALIEAAIKNVPDESQIEIENTILTLFMYMLKERYNIFEMDGEEDK